MAVAASLLRKGHDVLRIVEITQVPFALVELLAEHLPGNRPGDPNSQPTPYPRHHRQRLRHPGKPPPAGATPTAARTRAQWTLIAILTLLTSLTNLGLFVTAIATHRPILAAFALLGIAPVFAMPVLIARR